MWFFDKKKAEIEFNKLEVPWQAGRPSIYEHIKKHQLPGQRRLSSEGELLPDDSKVQTGQIRFAPGALDGAFGSSQDEQAATRIFQQLSGFLNKPSSAKLKQLYQTLESERALDSIDILLDRVVSSGLTDNHALYAFAKWLLKNSPDREIVKVAIAILGICSTSEDKELFLDIGSHDEFTLYACVALIHTSDTSADDLFELAKCVEGWGRIHAVDRIPENDREDIKRWLLSDGYKNNVMYGYTALSCAVNGQLLRFLSNPHVDDDVLTGAADILDNLVEECGPGPNIEAYEDAPHAILLALRHIASRAPNVVQVAAVCAMEEFLTKSSAERFDPVKEEALSLCAQILAKPATLESINQALRSEADGLFHRAAARANRLQIDVWPLFYDRVSAGKQEWYHLMRTNDQSRVERAVELARQLIPLHEVATGVSNEIGVGPEFRAHRALDFVLQDLRHWPGLGYDLIVVGLKSPVIRNRNMSLMALKHWGRDFWQDDTETLLRALLEVEPNDATCTLIRELLADKETA